MGLMVLRAGLVSRVKRALLLSRRVEATPPAMQRVVVALEVARVARVRAARVAPVDEPFAWCRIVERRRYRASCAPTAAVREGAVASHPALRSAVSRAPSVPLFIPWRGRLP